MEKSILRQDQRIVVAARSWMKWKFLKSNYELKKYTMKINFVTIAILFVSIAAFAQQKDYSKDVATVDATIAALYDVISGEAGQPRDWDRFNNLFKPESKLMPTRKTKEGELVVSAMAPSDY